MENKSVAIVLVNYGGHVDTIECLESVFKSSYSSFVVFVVDNSEGEKSLDAIKSWADGCDVHVDTSFEKLVFPLVEKPIPYVSLLSECGKSSKGFKLVFIKAESNRGFAAGNNLAFRIICDSRFDYIWVLNNDCVVSSESLSILVREMNFRSQSKIGILGTVLMDYYDPDKIQCVGGVLNSYFGTTTHISDVKYLKSVDYPVGASMFITSDFLKTVGYMNEAYFLYYEEIDWVLRARRHGYSFEILKDILVYHKEGKSTKANNKDRRLRSEFSDITSLRSRIIFMKTFYKSRMFFVYVGFIIVIVNRIRRGRIGIVGKIVKLIIDGK